MLLLAQYEIHVSHKDRFHFRLFEKAFPIGIFTFVFPVGTLLAADVYSFHRLDEVFHLYTVSTNILYGARTHLTGYQRQVLRTVPALLHTVSRKIIPYYTRTHTYMHLPVILRGHFHAADARVQHHAFIIFHKQQIATASYMQKRRSDAPFGYPFLQFLYRVIFCIYGSFYIKSECIGYSHKSQMLVSSYLYIFHSPPRLRK